MPIDVTCPGCHTRFKVSEKFAGKEGPCPKCKAKIQIPSAEEAVVVHAPEFGPKDSAGRAVLKPITRQEAKVGQWTWIVSIGILLAILITAVVLRDPEGNQPIWLLGAGAFLIAIPLARGGYAILRDDELQAYSGRELWIRLLVCATLYAASWAAITWLPAAFALEDLEIYEALILIGLVVAFGTAVCHFTLELEIGGALMHYGFFLAATVLMRLMMGLPFIPTELAS